jgi:dipeptidyl-peptidase-4
MRMKTVKLLALVLLLAPVAGWAQQKTTFRNLQEALQSGRALGGRNGPAGVVWIDGGRRLSFTARAASGEAEIRAMDPATGSDTLLFSAQGLTFPDTAAPFTYQSFDWSRDFRNLVFQTRFQPLYRRSGTSDYFVYSLADRQLRLATRGARTAELSPDGAMLGSERNGEMYVVDLASRAERRLTTGATETLYHGHFDWVYEEEFGLAQAWNWSPDSRYVAYWQVDESREPVIQISDFSGRHPTWDRIRIPQPGDTNATVRIGVSDARTGTQVWLDPAESGEFYIPRIYWTSRADTLAVVTLNRPQNTMTLYFFDVRTGGKRQVMRETSTTWVDVYDFFAGVQDLMTFPAGATQFFWISDRDGRPHIYRYDYSGRLVNQVTRGPWSATRIAGIDARAQTIYYLSTEAGAVQRQLYSIKFDGTAPRRITQTAGTHGIDMSPDTRFFIDRWSSTSQPRQVEMWATGATGAQKLRTMEDNAAVTTWLQTHAYAPTELFTFTTSDSARIDASMIRPPDFDSTRSYPVILTIYGGPGSQAVYDRWGSSGWSQWLAQQGYIVVDVNNRGNNNYGAAFLKAAYRRVGYWEAHDFAAAARYVGRMRGADSTRIGIMGTSHGGYATLMAMETYPEVFKVGISNSPTTDFRLYDTIWSERYLGLLGENSSAAYDSSAVLARAGRIRGKLLLVHSMMDDNVHVQHTMQFLTALTNAGVDADLRIYPPGRHGAVYNMPSMMLMQQLYSDYLDRWLKGR